MEDRINKVEAFICINNNQWFRLDIKSQSITEHFGELPTIKLEGQLMDDWKDEVSNEQ